MADSINAFVPSLATRWVWTESVLPNSFVAAARTLRLDSVPATAEFAVFADTKYKLYINGRFVNAGPAPFRKPVVWIDTYQVARWLVAGENTIAIIAHFVGTTTKYNTAEEPGILAELRIGADSATPVVVGTGADWRVAPLACWAADTPRRNWALEHVEDLSLSHPAFGILTKLAGDDYWTSTGQPSTVPGSAGEPADERAALTGLWQAPRVFERPDLEVRHRMVPELRWWRQDVPVPRQVFRGNTEVYNRQDTAVRLDHEHVWPELEETVYEMARPGYILFERREGEPGTMLLYDFGRVCAGEPAAEIVCENACTLDVCLAENLTAAGRPNIWRNGSLYYARYHLQPGINRVRFYHFNGHRYLYLVFKDAVGTVEIPRVTTHHCRADLDYRDSFSANDRAAESLYRISRRSIMLNTQAYAYDCNSREQGAYWGDGVWIADSVGHMTGDFAHLRHLCYAATEEVNACGPFIPASLYGLGAPLYDYCLVPAECLARYYHYTGDLKAVEDNIAAVRRIVARFHALTGPDGLLLLANLPAVGNEFRDGLLFLDHPGNGWHPQTTTGMDRRDINAGLNLFYLQALQALARLEQALGNDPADVAQEAAHLGQAIMDTCFVPARGLVADAAGDYIDSPRFSQIVNALAVMTGVLTDERARYALRTVLDVPRHPWVSQGTPYSYFFLADAAARAGLAAETVRCFSRDFRGMLERGATTTWEAWRAENHDSLNHAWSAPLPYLIRCGVLGLSPVTPGYTSIWLAPYLPAFDRFEATCCIPQGQVEMRWRRSGPQAFDLRVVVPDGVAAVLSCPGGDREFVGTWQGEVRIG